MASIKRHLTFGYSLLAILVVIIGTVFTVSTNRRTARKDLQNSAEAFVRLSASRLNSIFDVYYESAYQMFFEQCQDVLHESRDISRVEIISMDGTILFSTRAFSDPSFIPEQARFGHVDPGELRAVQSLNMTSEANDHLVIYFPVIETWGPHRHTLRYTFSLKRLTASTTSMIIQALIIALLTIVLILIFTQPLAKKIVNPLRDLAFHADMLAQGTSTKQIEIHRNDEIGDLMRSFNSMAEQMTDQLETLRKTNLQLENANRELKTLDQMKNDLIASVSHELRTPLITAKGYVEYLLHIAPEVLPREETERSLSTVLRNINRLRGLIDGLIDLSLLQRESFSVDILPFSPEDVLSSLKETYLNAAHPNGVKVHFHDHLPPDCQIKGDRDRVIQVMENLINNAIKFNKPRGFVDVFAEPLDGRIQFRVKDSGIGIPKDSLPRLGTKFFQVDASSRRKYGGLGLGLSIVSSILQSHGVSLQVDSEINEGSTFSFSLPMVKDESLKKVGKVLIYEPNRDFGSMVQARLAEMGLHCIVASSLDSFTETLSRERVHLLIADPVSENEVCDETLLLRFRDSGHKMTPFIFVTSVDRSQLSVSPHTVLRKPVSLSRLTRTVQTVLEEVRDAPDAADH